MVDNNSNSNRGKGLAALTPEQRLEIQAKSAETRRLRKEGLLPPKPLKKRTLRSRVKDKCMDCSGEQRIEVAMCATTGCSLWDVRPYKKTRNKASNDAVLDEFDI